MSIHYYRFGNPTFCKFVSKALTEQGVSVAEVTERILVVEGDPLTTAQHDLVTSHGGMATYVMEVRLKARAGEGMPKFKIGDRVRLAKNPKYVGKVQHVAWEDAKEPKLPRYPGPSDRDEYERQRGASRRYSRPMYVYNIMFDDYGLVRHVREDRLVSEVTKSENIEPTMEQAPPAAPKKKVPPMKAAKNLKKPDPQKPKQTPKQQADAAKMKVIQDAAMKTLKARVESEPKKFPKLAAALGIKTEAVEKGGEAIQEVSPPSGPARCFSENVKGKRKIHDQVPVKSYADLERLTVAASKKYEGEYILAYVDFGLATVFAASKLPTNAYASDDWKLGYWRNGKHFDWSEARKRATQRAVDKLSGLQ